MRVAFDFDVATEPGGRRVQERVSRFQRERLEALLEAGCRDFDDPDAATVLDRLDLDLGWIEEDRLEQELEDRLARAFRAALAESLPGRMHRASVEASGAFPQARIEPLSQTLGRLADFLERGRLPAGTGGPDGLWYAALDQAPLGALALLRRLGSRAIVRRRLAHQCSENILRLLPRLLAPAHADALLSVLDEAGAASRSEAERRRLWEFALAELLAARPGLFSAAAFRESLERRDAGRSGRPFEPAEEAAVHAPPAAMAPARRRLERLAEFLDRGTGALTGPDDAPAALLLQAIAEVPDPLLTLLRRLGQRERVRRRLAYEFAEPALHALVRLLEPSHHGLVVAYVRQVSRAQAESPVVPQDQPVFRKRIWEFVLSYLLVDRGSRFNARTFVKSMLMRMAAHYRVDYRDLLLHLIARVEALRLTPSQKYALPAILLSLSDEEQTGLAVPEVPMPPLSVDPRRADRYSDFDLLAFWLTRGSLPAWSAARRPGDLAPLWRRLIEEQPDRVQELAAGLRHDPALAGRLAGSTDSAAARSVWQLLAPGSADDAGRLLDILGRHGRANTLPGMDGKAVHRLVRELLSGLLLQAPEGLATGALVRRLRDGLARRLALEPEAATRFLTGAIDTAARQAPLPAALAEAQARLAVELPALAAVSPEAAPPVPAPPEPPGTAELLRRWLAHGILPGPLAEAGGAGLSAWLDRIPEAEVADVLKRVGPALPALRRIAEEGFPEFFERVVRALARSAAGQVLELGQALDSLAESFEAAAADSLFRMRVREYLLAGLLTVRLEPLSLEELAGRVAEALAARYGLAMDLVAERLANSVRQPALAELLRSLPAKGRLRDRAARAESQSRGPVPVTRAEPVLGAMEAWLSFLEGGVAPPGAGDLLAAPVGPWFRAALADAPERLLAALGALAKRPDALRRLLRYLPVAELSLLVERLAPDHAGFVLTFLLAGMALDAQGASGAPPRGRAADIHWQIVLDELLSSQGAELSANRFIEASVQRVAQRLGLSIREYVAELRAVAESRAPAAPRYAVLAEVLAAVFGATAEGAPAMETGPVARPAPASSVAAGRDGMIVGAPALRDLPLRFRHFMQYGIWPETGPETRPSIELPPERLLADFRARPAEYREWLFRAAGRAPERERLLRFLPPAGFRDLLQLLVPADADAARFALDSLKASAIPGLSMETLTYIAVDELLRSVAGRPGRRLDFAVWLHATLLRLAAAAHADAVELHERLRRTATASPPGSRRDPLLRALGRIAPRLRRPPPAPVDKPVEPSARPYRKDEPEAEELPAGESFFIDNAGMVLLWPFLPRYFEMLGLVEARQFRDEAARNRGVGLLQFLATGEAEAPEPVLLLNKILCGLPSGLPPEPRAPLSEAERELSEELLYGVTRNWSKLQNTSIAGLREAFLQRDGRLVRKDDGAWELAVAARPFDMLLDSLPWGLSVIRLAWMTQPLHVKWR